jgi:hypothetical protein
VLRHAECKRNIIGMSMKIKKDTNIALSHAKCKRYIIGTSMKTYCLRGRGVRVDDF